MEWSRSIEGGFGSDMDNYSLRLAWSDEDGAWVAVSPEFPGLSALGASPELAIEELRVAMELAVDEIREAGGTPPPPLRVSGYSGQFRLRLPRELHEMLSLRGELEGVSLNTLVVMYLSWALGWAQAGSSGGPSGGCRTRAAVAGGAGDESTD